MAKNSIRDYANTAASNTDVQSVNIDEGCSPAGINNAIREVMADLADVSDGTVALESPSADSLSTDTINEKTSATGVTVDGVLLKDSQVTTDTINEKTADTGVTVDGVLLKDSKLDGSYITDGTIDADSLANDAVTTDKILNDAVTSDKYSAAIASQVEAEAGTDNTKIMTPQRTKQAIDNAAQSTAFDAVGTYAFLMKITDGNITAGGTYSGSDLRPASFGRNSWDGATVQNIVGDYVSGTSMTGTWRAMGGSDSFASATDKATLFVKISS